MRKILVLGAGGSASTGFIRSLRLAPEQFHIIGADCNKYYLQRAETEEKYLVPRADNPDYIPTLNKIEADFIHVQNDLELEIVSENREKLKAKTFLPPKSVISICQNKWKSRQYWQKDGIQHPKTFLVKSYDDILPACHEINGWLWVRDIKGAGGKGSLKTNDYKAVLEWIKFKQGWGYYTIAEYLSERTTTFSTVWKDGNLILGQGRKRLYWELGPAFISGVSGATGQLPE